MLCSLEKGGSFQDIYKKVISKARMWPHSFHTLPGENQAVAGTWVLSPRECLLRPGKFFRVTCCEWKRQFSYSGCKEQNATNYLGQSIVRLPTKVKGVRTAAAWGGAGVASLEPRNTCVNGPHRGSEGTGSALSSRAPCSVRGPGSCCFLCSCHIERMSSPSTLVFAYSSFLLTPSFQCPRASLPDSN